ncbi:MAG: hydroxymethylbilane synthase [FCB group bacterium]|nr:hydroxymethylbilane synthase [FCB group bacterium]
MKRTLIIGSRASRLAVAQARHVAELLRRIAPDIPTRLLTVTSTGDRITDRPIAAIGAVGAFTAELESALIEGQVDLAVHSMKDLPIRNQPGVISGAVPQREDPRDALVCRRWLDVLSMPSGARIGTSSPRRVAQLRALRLDLETVDLRGNIETRIQHVQEGRVDAAILACAGLRRLGLETAIRQEFSPDDMLPSPGQGALDIHIRAEETGLKELLRLIADPAAEVETRAERALLAALGGGCSSPVGALGRLQGQVLTLAACMPEPEGEQVWRVTGTGDPRDPESLGTRLADTLLRSEPAGARKSE